MSTVDCDDDFDDDDDIGVVYKIKLSSSSPPLPLTELSTKYIYHPANECTELTKSLEIVLCGGDDDGRS